MADQSYENQNEYSGEDANAGSQHNQSAEYNHDEEGGYGGDSQEMRNASGDQMGQEYEEGEEEGEFDDNVPEIQKQYRKIKKDILDNLNKVRDEHKLPKLYIDLYSSKIATDYAEYLKTNPHYPDYFKSLCLDYNNFGDLNFVYTISKYEEDVDITPEVFYQAFIDLGYLLLESQEDKSQLLNTKYNHIGIGISSTAEFIILVEVFSEKKLAISKISDGEDGGIEIRGKMLVDTDGIYAVRLQNVETKKDLIIVGPEKIEFDRNTKEFIIFIDVEETVTSSNKVVEFYVRVKPESIEYKTSQQYHYLRKRPEKFKLRDLELVLRCPCEIHPDPIYGQDDPKEIERKNAELQEKKKAEEDAKLRKMEERQARKEARRLLRQEIEERRIRGEEIESLASSTQRSDRSFLSKGSLAPRGYTASGTAKAFGTGDPNQTSQSPEKDMRSEYGFSIQRDDNRSVEDDKFEIESKIRGDRGLLSPDMQKEPTISNREIREELETAIAEAKKQRDKLLEDNYKLQEKIIILRQKNDAYIEKQTDIGMNEHKYLNTLAHVHQIRIDLKQTQDRYNKMAADLQMKLEEKQKKCNEIKQAFMELKREVAKKAAFSRTDKPISEKQVEEWEILEAQKNKELQALRLDNLRLRNTLAKNQKILKKKEEIAEGLHLIDFEQLKIENQTLNEKIEERNEDLHKLKKKETTTVQILTHTKEKLEFIIAENAELLKQGQEKEQELEKLRQQITDLKTERDQFRAKNQKLRQETGIVRSKELSNDFENRKKDISLDEAHVKYLQEKHKYMRKVIEDYNAKMSLTKNGTQKNPAGTMKQKRIFQYFFASWL